MSLLGNTFEEQYTNFFKFFSAKHTKSEIENFIKKNKIPSYSNSILERIHLNMIDNQNLNILFHIIIKSDSDSDCLEKLKYLIEEHDLNYNVFDFIHHRTLPFYTCVRGFLESTKYLINKMNFNIDFKERNDKTLFFPAIKSYNIKLIEYLDHKYPGAIFSIDDKKNTCIFEIFKKDMKKKEEIENLKNILRFILNRGFKIDAKNKEGISFREKCGYSNIDNILNEIIKEFGGELKEKNKENENDNKMNNDKKEIIKEKEEVKNNMKNPEKINNSNNKIINNTNINDNNMIKNELIFPKFQNTVKFKLPNSEIKNEKNNEIKPNKNNNYNFDFDIEMDDEFIKSESKKIFNNNKLKVKEERINNFNKCKNSVTKKKVCAFLSKKRHNLILKEESLNALRSNENFKKYFISKN